MTTAMSYMYKKNRRLLVCADFKSVESFTLGTDM